MTRIGDLTIQRCGGWLATGRAPITIVLFQAPLLPEGAKPDVLWEQQPRELVNLISNR